MTDDKQDVAVIEAPAELPIVSSPADIFFNIQLFEHVQRVAKLFASSNLVPDRNKGADKIGDCVIALSMAHRLKADPIMIMQNTYVVHGSPGMEGKLVIALINQCGKFSQLLFKEEENEAGEVVECTAFCSLKDTGEEISTAITWDEVVGHGWTKNQKWETMRLQMFRYRAATFFARTFCPEVLFGMQTVEELKDTANQDESGAGGGAGAALNNIIDKSATTEPVEGAVVLNEKTTDDQSQTSSQNQEEEDIAEENLDGAMNSDHPDHPFNRSKWISIKTGASLQSIVKDHPISWATTTNETRYEFYQKWKRILKSLAVKLWPFENMEDKPADLGTAGDDALPEISFYIVGFADCADTEELKAFFIEYNTDILNHPEKDAIIKEYDRLMDSNKDETDNLKTTQDFLNFIYHAKDTGELSALGMKKASVIDTLDPEQIYKAIDDRLADLNRAGGNQ